MRYLTVTPNAAIDTTYILDTFQPGGANRVSQKLEAPGGKGNNVARVLALLGCDVTATGFVAGRAGEYIEDGLRALGIEPRFARAPGESRRCLTLVERDTGTITEALEPGVKIPPDAAEELIAQVRALAEGMDAVALCGSLPPGLPPNYYAQLLDAARPAGSVLALDTGGDALRRGLAGRPTVIKPNRDELRELMGREVGMGETAAFVRRELLGATMGEGGVVLVSLGAEGALLIARDQGYRAEAPPVSVVNTVGCGDALLAGYLSAPTRHDDPAAALARAVATGTAAALHETAGVVRREDVESILPLVECSPLEA